jgi:glycosyltransferase involved in cell wall biosynthesis
MPSYNHEGYIGEALNSVMEQSYQNFEIVITDDGSTDDTVKIIQSINDKRIKLLVNPVNKGISATLNSSIARARGEYISVMGSDDIYEKDKLKKQISVLKSNKNIGAIFGWADIVDNEGTNINKGSELYKLFQQKNKNRFEWLRHFFYKDNCLCASSAMVRKSCHDEVGYYDERFMQLQDLDLWIRILRHYEIDIIPETLVKYRVLKNSKNVSSEKSDSISRIAWEKLSILENYLDISNDADIIRIFPHSKNISPSSQNFVPEFVISLNSYKSSNPVNKVFAINTMLRLFKDREIAGKIEKIHKFSYKDLSEAMGKNDMFNSQEYNELLKENSLLKNKDYFILFIRKIVSLIKR